MPEPQKAKVQCAALKGGATTAANGGFVQNGLLAALYFHTLLGLFRRRRIRS